MTTWANPVHMHPWFRMPSHKRKAFDLDSSSSDSSDFETYTVPPKRRRCDVLESGLAHLSLNPVLHTESAAKAPQIHPHEPQFTLDSLHRRESPRATSQPPAYQSWNAYNDSYPPSIRGFTPVVLPSSVEEPTSPETLPDVPEVTMKSRSWYEPEKDREYTSPQIYKLLLKIQLAQAS